MSEKWHDTFLSANDGGSGVALLMELANHLKDLKTQVGVDLVFFDGEEYVFDRHDQYFFGSETFAGNWSKSNPRPDYQAAILLDMVGGKDARFPFEDNSRATTGSMRRHLEPRPGSIAGPFAARSAPRCTTTTSPCKRSASRPSTSSTSSTNTGTG